MSKPEFIPKAREVEAKVLPKIRPASGFMFFTTSLQQAKGNVIDSGSFSLIYSGKRFLLVTCYHVWNDFLMQRAKNPNLKLAICLDYERPLIFCTLKDGTKTVPIDQDEGLDIAIFDITPFMAFCQKRHFFRLDNGGEKFNLQEGSTIAIVGFPGKHRKELDEGISYGRDPYIGFASSICGHKFMVDFTKMMTLEGKLVFKHGQKNYGGISGGPCFIIRSDYEPFLVGFVTDQWDPLESTCRHASLSIL